MQLPSPAQSASLNMHGGPQAVMQQGIQALTNPQAAQAPQTPGGISPQLLELLAAQKALQMQQAGKNAVLAQAQTQPTVVARVQQKLHGAAMQDVVARLGQGQQQPGQGQPAPQGIQQLAQQPIPPTQAMAKGGKVGGIDALPSNLKMAGGGIIAFENGGDVKYQLDNSADTTPFAIEDDDTDEQIAAKRAAYRKYMRGDSGEGADGGIAGLLQHVLGWAGAGGATANNMQSAARLKRQAGTPAQGIPAAVEPTLGDTQDPGPRGMDALRQAAAAGDPDAIKAYALFSAKYPQPTSSAAAPASMGVAAPQGIAALPEAPARPTNDFIARQQAALEKDQAYANPEARQADREKHYKDNSGIAAYLTGTDADRAQQRDLYEAAKATRMTPAQAAFMAAHNAPRRFGNGIAELGAGLAAADVGGQQTMHGYANEDIANNKALIDMHQQALQAALGDNQAMLKTGSDASDKAMALKGQLAQAGAMEAGRISASENAAAARIESAKERADAAARSHIDQMAGKEAQIAARTHDLAMKMAEAAATKASADPMQSTQPGFDPEKVFWSTYNRSMATVPGFAPVATPAAAAGIDLSKWGQSKVKS